MTDNERMLIRCICERNNQDIPFYTRQILMQNRTKKDEDFCKNMLDKLDKRGGLTELPQDVKNLLWAEDPSKFATGKYMVRTDEEPVANKVLALYHTSEKLAKKGISYNASLLLYGESGCGKTELARYIAYKAKLPFLHVRFSNLVDSLLGSTQRNLGKVFSYAKEAPCVLCFDELDAIGTVRGMQHESGEISRVTIALMQELDQLSNNIIIIGTTNRFDQLDPALARRFSYQYEVKPLAIAEAQELARKFFVYADVDEAVSEDWYESAFRGETIPASSVIKACTETVVKILNQENA